MPMPDDKSSKESYALLQLKKEFSEMSKEDLELYALCQTIGATFLMSNIASMGIPQEVIQYTIGQLLKAAGMSQTDLIRSDVIARQVMARDKTTGEAIRRRN